jgi:hypothetical protein
VRQFLAETRIPDPVDCAEAFLETLTTEDLREALRESLPDVFRVEMSKDRMRPEPHNGSAKWKMVTRGWLERQHLLAGGEAVMLLDATAERLRAAAAYHFEKAAREASTGDAYTEIASEMEARGVDTVRDLVSIVGEDTFIALYKPRVEMGAAA